MCDPILVTLLKMLPHYSQSSRENATPSSGTSPVASHKEVPPPLGVEEQLHNSVNRSNYSFNMMLPGNHLFMMRLKLHSSNTKINQVYRKKLETVFRAHLGPHTSLLSDERGILILQRTLFERERHSRDSVMAATHTSSTTSTPNETSFAQQSSAADGIMHTTDGHPNVTLPPKSNNSQQVNLVI